MRTLLAGWLFLFLLLPASGGDTDAKKPLTQEELEKVLRKLEKDIAQVRELTFKEPVKARIISRSKDAAPGVQGYYSLKDKSLFLYDDIKGNYQMGVLIHEMVHALQDQHFGLKNLHETNRGSGDSDLAMAALIEGDATYTMIELLKKDQPRVAAMLDSPLEKSQNLHNSFLYAQGARYVKALKEKDGWKAVNRVYAFSPGSTASILSPGENVSTIDLGTGKKLGALELIGRLRESKATHGDAVQALSGWRGDREIVNADGKGLLVAFASPEQARRYREALTRFVQAEVADLKPTRQGPDEMIGQTAKQAIWAVLQRGNRVALVEAKDQAAFGRLRDRLEGPPLLEVHSASLGKRISFGEMIEQLLSADVICIGETHDSDLHHQVQLQIIKSLFGRDERLGVGMEMFQRPYQKHLDRYFRGDTSEKTFLEDAEYLQRWGFDWSLYRPIVEFCRKNSIPLAALNVATEVRRRLSAVGYDKLTDDDKKQLGTIDFQVKAHRDYWYDRLAKMHGDYKATPEQKEKSYQVMTTWDEYMADSAARFQQERGLRRMVVLAGSGHIERGFGIPQRVVKRTGGKSVTIKIEIVGEKAAQVEGEPVADFTVFVK
jgi:uncharacterized iron-regulated protein